MNDYLINLAARSLNPTPALQPRLRSRFEPAPPVDDRPHAASPDWPGLAVETADIESATPVATRVAVDRRAIASITQEGRENESITPRETSGIRLSGMIESSPGADSIGGMSAKPRLTIRQPELIGGSDEESPRLPQERRPQPLIREQIVIKEILRPTRTTSESAPRAVLSEASAKDLIDGASLAADRGADSSLATARGADSSAQMEISLRSESARGDAGTTVAEAEFAPERSVTSLPIIAQPRVRPFLEDRSDEKAAQSTPTIHVTIGRVEVRATQSTSTAPTKSRPARPAMSLDDYLRGRGNGGAR